MKKKQKKHSTSIVVFFLCILMVFHTLTNPIVAYAETRVEPSGYIKFANLGTDKLNGGSGYLKLNLSSYGIGMTTNGSLASTKGTNKYDVVTTSSVSRVSYQRKLEVSYGAVLSLAGGVKDSGADGTDAANDKKIVWNVMEWDKDGLLVSDSGWMYTNQSYTVGVSRDVSTWSTSDYWGPMDRKDVKYVTLIFRLLNAGDSLANGTGMNNAMSKDDLISIFPNMYLCYNPFTYTVKNTSGTTLATLNRYGATSMSLNSYVPTAKTGYTSGFKISSSSSLTPNWMNGNIYTATQVNTWLSNGKFYNSLFGNVTFTQAYIPHTYTVKYNANNGSGTTADSSHTYGTSKKLTANGFSRTGYTFAGWATTAGGSVVYTNEQSVSNLTPTNGGTVNLYAVWTPNTYTITLNNQSATTAGTTAYYEKYNTGNYSNANCTTAISTITKPTRTGYTFGGYFTETGGSGTQYINASGGISATKTTFTKDTTLYAKWTINSYTIRYNANGGSTSAASKTVAYGGAVDLSPTANKTGYTFIGWSTSSTARVPLSSYTMPASNVTLYAVYSINVSDIQNHDYPAYTATPNVSNDEVFLKLWIKNTTNCRYFSLTYSQDVNTLVYRYTLPAASSSEIASFVSGREFCYQLIVRDNAGNEAVLYDGSGGTPIPPEPKKYTQTVKHYTFNPIHNAYNAVEFLFEQIDVLEGTTFTPSYTTAPAGYSAYSKDAGKTVSSANTYNVYYRPNTYTITFNANGGSVNPLTQTVTYANYYPALPAPVRPGYTFLGWNTAQNGTGKMVKDGDIYTTAGGQTLYAQWKANVYEIKLDSQNATNPGTDAFYQKYDTGNFAENTCSTAISKITAPSRTGYTFGGYYTERNGTGTQYVDAFGNILSTKSTFTSNMKLYAKWTANTYTVRYNANGGTGEMLDMTVIYDTTVKLSSNLYERTGYSFAGWATSADEDVVYNDKQSVTNLSTINGAVVNLYAVWDINSYEVTYDYWTNGGIGAEEDKVMVNYNAPIDLNVPAEKSDGFTFVGWNTDASATTGLTSLKMGTENVTLYAVYQKTINVTLTERNEDTTIETVLSKTIYNNTNQADFIIIENGSLNGWRNNGWSDATEATAQAITSTGATFTTKDSIRLYALYISDVTVSYDTNGSIVEYENVTMERFHNASGDYFYPVFDIEIAPEMTQHSFVMWEATDGATYNANVPAEIKETTVLKAVWDQFPYIEAYDRYFTLEQAQSGYITHEELLGKVTATDREDGKLVNGTEVIVKDYDAKLFAEITEDTDIEIVYQAKDDFENIVTKQITVGIRDTSMKEGTKKYVRFIGRDFLEDEDGKLLSEEAGGLEKTSIWRRNESYLSLLRNVLSKVVPEKETISFTADELKKLKEMSPAN